MRHLEAVPSAIGEANAAKAPFIVIHTGGLARKQGQSAKLRLARSLLLESCDEPPGQRDGLRTGVNQTQITIIEVSANELLKALSRVLHTRRAGAPACSRLARSEWPKPATCRRSGSGRAAVPKAILLALSLSLAGCAVSRPTTTTRLIPPARAETEVAHELPSATKQPEPPSTPAQPAPQPAQRVSETRPPPATASKSAEKPATPSTPAVVRASVRTALPIVPSVPRTPITVVSGTVTDAPVQALVFSGPPPEARALRSGIKWWVWLGLGLVGAALAVVAWFYAIRRAKSANLAGAGKDELKMPPELLFKEPLNLPQ